MKSKAKLLLDQYKEKLIALLGYDPEQVPKKPVTPVAEKKLSISEKLQLKKETDKNRQDSEILQTQVEI